MSNKYFGSSEGLTIKSAAGTAFVSNDFNTGYMGEQCKLAALCDTETGSISAPELVTNGTFDTDTDWTKGTGVTISGNKANAVNTSGTLIEQPESFDDVKVCSFSFTVSNYAGGSVTAKWGTSKDVSPVITGDGSYTYYAEHGAADSDSIRFFASNFTGAISNVSVKEVTPDRSGNNNHLNIIGTLNRAPIGNGEIAAWSGFSVNDYLEMPYSSAFDFGTGDFSIHALIDLQTFVSEEWYLTRDDTATPFGSDSFYLRRTTATAMTMHFSGSGATVSFTIPTIGLIFVSIIRASGVGYVYLNGGLVGSVATVANLDNTAATIKIGMSRTGAAYSRSPIVSLRISKIASTPDQIAKMYHDELAMIQGKATLYGNSDAVTALAHDPITDLLHVGTSDGRSVFDGLTRVDETTDPVTAAISAVDCLVVEG